MERVAGPEDTTVEAALHIWRRKATRSGNNRRPDRIRQVYRLMGHGETTAGIAAAMNISTRTVESYYARIMVKLGLDGMRALRRDAIARPRNTTATDA